MTNDLTNINAGPSAEHWFGTDNLGRDILARVLVATRLSLGLALTATAIGLVVGVILGAMPERARPAPRPVLHLGGEHRGGIPGLAARTVLRDHLRRRADRARCSPSAWPSPPGSPGSPRRWRHRSPDATSSLLPGPSASGGSGSCPAHAAQHRRTVDRERHPRRRRCPARVRRPVLPGPGRAVARPTTGAGCSARASTRSTQPAGGARPRTRRAAGRAGVQPDRRGVGAAGRPPGGPVRQGRADGCGRRSHRGSSPSSRPRRPRRRRRPRTLRRPLRPRSGARRRRPDGQLPGRQGGRHQPGTGREPAAGARRIGRDRRRVRVRQEPHRVGHRPADHPAGRGQCPPAAIRGDRTADRLPRRAARPARQLDGDGVPGPDELAEPDQEGRQAARRGGDRAPGCLEVRGMVEGGRPAAGRPDTRGESEGQAVPVRVLRRHAAAGDDRHGADGQPFAADRRRTHHRAGCHGAAAGAPADGPGAGGGRREPAADLARRLGDRLGVRPGRGDVRREGGRGAHRRRAAGRAGAPLHPGAAHRCPGHGHAAGPSADHDPRPAPAAHRVPGRVCLCRALPVRRPALRGHRSGIDRRAARWSCRLPPPAVRSGWSARRGHRRCRRRRGADRGDGTEAVDPA